MAAAAAYISKGMPEALALRSLLIPSAAVHWATIDWNSWRLIIGIEPKKRRRGCFYRIEKKMEERLQERRRRGRRRRRYERLRFQFEKRREKRNAFDKKKQMRRATMKKKKQLLRWKKEFLFLQLQAAPCFDFSKKKIILEDEMNEEEAAEGIMPLKSCRLVAPRGLVTFGLQACNDGLDPLSSLNWAQHLKIITYLLVASNMEAEDIIIFV